MRGISENKALQAEAAPKAVAATNRGKIYNKRTRYYMNIEICHQLLFRFNLNLLYRSRLFLTLYGIKETAKALNIKNVILVLSINFYKYDTSCTITF